MKNGTVTIPLDEFKRMEKENENARKFIDIAIKSETIPHYVIVNMRGDYFSDYKVMTPERARKEFKDEIECLEKVLQDLETIEQNLISRKLKKQKWFFKNIFNL